MMRPIAHQVKSPTYGKYVVRACWMGNRTPAAAGRGTAVTRPQQNAGKWPRTFIDGPKALAYKPPQSRRLIAAASGAAERRSGDNGETDLPAEQTRTQAPPWLPRAHGE